MKRWIISAAPRVAQSRETACEDDDSQTALFSKWYGTVFMLFVFSGWTNGCFYISGACLFITENVIQVGIRANAGKTALDFTDGMFKILLLKCC